MRLLVLAALSLAACHSAAPVGGSLTVLAALTQMLDAGTITVEQWWTALAGGGLAAALAYFKAKSGAVRKVMDLRGPTEAQRRAASAAPPA